MPKINFAAVKGIEPIPAGNYLASIIDVKEGMSKTQNIKFDVQWKVEGGPFDGRRIFDTWSFHPDAQFRVKAYLKALGWDSTFSGDVTPAELVGKTATIVVTIDVSTQTDESGDPYPPRNVVKKVKPVDKVMAAKQGKGMFGRNQPTTAR